LRNTAVDVIEINIDGKGRDRKTEAEMG